MSNKKSVLVALSGGVDSSVTAHLLQKKGFSVHGIMLRVWHVNENSFDESVGYAESVAKQLGITFEILDVRSKFKQCIIDSYISESISGITPNPCIECNRDIKWGALSECLNQHGYDYLATGHYAKLLNHGDDTGLYRARDLNKDQSYMLSVVPKHQLERTILPLGDLLKTDVRSIAQQAGIRAVERRESQELCFMDGMSNEEFISTIPEVNQPGDIVDVKGNFVGKHKGFAFYTIGQRKGLGKATGYPQYVLSKDVVNNRIIIGSADHLGRTNFHVNRINLLAPVDYLHKESFVKIRYRSTPVSCTVREVSSAEYAIELSEPLRDITPGQQAVFYLGDRVIMSGRIKAY